MVKRRYAFLGYALVLLLAVLAPAVFAADYFSWPVDGTVITPFSPGEHRGIDIAAPVGSRITAADEGVVYWVGRTPRGEPCVSIDHPSGHSTSYLPVEASVIKGQKVTKGAVIGVLSADGDPSSQEPHLHLGLFETSTRDNKHYLNPQQYLMARSVETSSDMQTVPAAEHTDPRAGAEAPAIVETQVEQSAVTQPVVAVVGLPVATTAPAAGVSPQSPTPQSGTPERQISRAPQTGTPGSRKIEVPSTVIQLATLPSNAAVLEAGKIQVAPDAIDGGFQGLTPAPAVSKNPSAAYAGQHNQAASVGFASSYPGSTLEHNTPQTLPNIVVSGATPVNSASAKPKELQEMQIADAMVGPNPFGARKADAQAARPLASAGVGQTGYSTPVSTTSNQTPFKTSILADLVLAFALTLSIAVSFRFVRRVKKQALSVLTETPATSACAA